MKPSPFHYHAPKTIEETVATLARVAPDDGRVLAGGQSLAPTMAFAWRGLVRTVVLRALGA